MVSDLVIRATEMKPMKEGYRCPTKELDRRAKTNEKVLTACKSVLKILGKKTDTDLSPSIDLECWPTGDRAELSHVLACGDDDQATIADVSGTGVDSLTGVMTQLLTEVVDVMHQLHTTTDPTQPIAIGCENTAAISASNELVCSCAKEIALAQTHNASGERYVITFDGKKYDVTLKPNTPTTHYMGNNQANGLITQPCPASLTLVLLQGRSKTKMGFPEEMIPQIDDFYIRRIPVLIQYEVHQTFHCGSRKRGEERKIVSIDEFSHGKSTQPLQLAKS